jgi:hypothetical protein
VETLPYLTQLITVTATPPNPVFSMSNQTNCGGTDGFLVISCLAGGASNNMLNNGMPDQVYAANSNGHITIENLSSGTYQNFILFKVNCPTCSFTYTNS